MKFHHFITLLILALLLPGCSGSSILIRADDATFVEAQSRMTRMAARVNELNPPRAERTLFLQGESFYQYRFNPPPRNTKSFLAEAAAAMTDFPAFQALAGSLSLLDIRIRASDSAIQLWESLLLNYPKTQLRPLTLYRLGWAYRNVSVEGAPRESPDEAFDDLIKESGGTPLASLAQEAKSIDWKSKRTAASRSLIPGLGQIYVGETGSGIVRMGVAAIAVAAIVIPILIARRRSADLNLKHDWPLMATGFGGLVLLSLDYTSSYEDAMRGVVQWNERAENDFNRTHPSAP